LRTFSFHAREKRSGDVDGQFTLQARQGDGFFKADIACMNVFDNRAVMAGFITRAPEGSTFREGGNFGFMVEDNGEGNGGPADQITLVTQFPVPQPCCETDQDILDILCASEGEALTGLIEIEAGNVQVRP
jgi:hypothetical protein